MVVPPRAESGRLRVELEGPPPSLTLVRGPPGVGKSDVVRDATEGLEVARYWAASLTDADHRGLLVARLGRWAEPAERPGAGPARSARASSPPARLSRSAAWPQIFEHLVERSSERRGTLRLVLEEFPRLVETHSKLLVELERFWSRVRAHGLPVHLVLTGRDGPAFDALRADGGVFAGWIGADLTVSPLGVRDVARLFRGYSTRDRFLAWAIFGGLAGHLRACDPVVSLSTNVRQAVLSPGAPLLLAGAERLQLELQSPPRYASVLRGLAEGRREWGEILSGGPDFTSGGQMAPYLARLQELGLVVGEMSLDSAPGSRSRRYRIPDPFLAFWYRFVLPRLTDVLDGKGKEVWRTHVRPHLDAHAARYFPVACRDHLLHHSRETLGATARELGGLWGADYDIDLAGTLRNGSAFYGRALWGSGRIPEAADEVLHEEVRRTRYGFGRERRIRLIFGAEGFSPALIRRAARSDLLHLVGMDELLGG